MNISKAKKHFLIYILLVSVLFSAFAPLQIHADNIDYNQQKSISTSAKSAILLELSQGIEIYSKNAEQRLPMASTTKIMTAIVTIENSDISEMTEVNPKACGIEGSSVYLYENEKISIENLLYALMLQSANDAAVALAYAVCGCEEDFVSLMNSKAEELGLVNTHFTNPHGLDNENHYTTAKDFATLTAYAIKNQTFKTIVSTRKKSIPLQETEGQRLLINHNKMLRFYDGAIGVKTGFTKRSGRCLVSAAERNGLTLIAVTLSAPDDWNDHTKMLDYGFANYEKCKLTEKGDFVAEIPITNGTSASVSLRSSENVFAVLKKTHGKISCETRLRRFSFAPVLEGETLGKLIFSCDGKIIGTCDIVSNDSVQSKILNRSIKDKIKRIFAR